MGAGSRYFARRGGAPARDRTDVDAFRSAFVERSDAMRELFARRVEWDLPAFRRLVITPEARRDLRPLVGVSLARAPALAGWEFCAHRLPESLETARRTVEARCGRPSRLAEVVASRCEHHLVDLEFSGPHAGEDEDAALRDAYVLCEALSARSSAA